jgi:hypothetical protein
MASEVFISHSTKDKDVADAVCAALESSGIGCWIAPRDIKPGESWAASILHGTYQCRLLVLIFSSHANESKQVAREVERAVHRGVPILTLRIHDVMPQDGLEYFLSSSQFIEAIKSPFEAHLAALVEMVGHLIRAGSRGGDTVTSGRPPLGVGELPIPVVSALSARSVAEFVAVQDRLQLSLGSPGNPRNDVLHGFLTAAQHVDSYVALNSLSHKQAALNGAMKELARIQSTLAGRSDDFLLTSANEWRAVLDAERRKIEAELEASQPIRNPFVVGNPVQETESNLFSGRRDIVRQIEESLVGAAQSPLLLLYGPRRMGKSTILNQLPRLMGPDFAVAAVDFQSSAVTGSAATLLKYFSQAVCSALRGRRLHAEPLTLAQLAEVPYAVFDEWLDNVIAAMPQTMRVLLSLDEYERLQAAMEAGWGGAMLDFMRHLIQHRPRFVLLFAGVRTFAQMGPAWTDRLISARRIRVSLLRREEVIPLLTKPVPDFALTYEPGALEALIEPTNGQPFLTQAVASELVQVLNEQRRRNATSADVELAVLRAMESGGEYLANLWTDAGSDGQAVMLALAAGDNPPHCPEGLVRIREMDVLNASGDFAVPLVRSWVRREKLMC